MGTIPPPSPEYTLDEYVRSTELNQNAQQLRQQQAVQQQQIARSQQEGEQSAQAFPIAQQSAQLQLEQQQREAQDEIRIRDAYKNSGGDLTKFQQGVQQAGVGPKAALGAVTMVNGMRKSVNDLSESDLALTKTKHEQFAPMLDEVANADPKEQPSLWMKQIADAQKRGLITPEEAQQHTEYPGPDGVDLYRNSLKTVDQLINERKQQTEEQKAQAGDWKEGGGGTLVNVNPKSPQFGKIVHGAGAVDQQEMNDWIAKHPGKGPAEFMAAKALAVPQFNIKMGVTGAGMIPGAAATGGTGGAAAPPPTVESVPNSIKGTVQQIVDYRAQLPPAGRNNPTNNAIRYWVNALDPQHDDTTFPARNKLMTNLTSGPGSKSIGAINTALGHMGVLSDAADALNNSDGGVKALRAIANQIGVQVGDTPVTTFNTIVHRVGPELASAYVEGGGSAGERGADEKDFDPALGGAQIKKNIAISAQLLRSKIGSTENQYKQTMGRDDFQKRFITPEAQATLDKLAPQGGGGAAAPKYKVGDSVNYKGAPHKITAVDPTTGKLTLAP